MECNYCKKKCTKAGLQKTGVQKYHCPHCGRYQQSQYIYRACKPDTDHWIKGLTVESCGIRSTSRLLGINPATVQSRIAKIANSIRRPPIVMGRTYEMDELRTFVGGKDRERWVIYALDRESKEVVDLKVGRRTKKHIGKVVDTLLLSGAKRIYTDGLDIYRYLVPEPQHKVKARHTNHIERKNLNLRTHLKRLSRKTLCYSKSQLMLEACLRIYFWGGQAETWQNIRVA